MCGKRQFDEDKHRTTTTPAPPPVDRATEQEAKENLYNEMAERAPHLTFFVGDWASNPTDRELLYRHRVNERSIPSMRHAVVVDAGVKILSTAKVSVAT